MTSVIMASMCAVALWIGCTAVSDTLLHLVHHDYVACRGCCIQWLV